MKLAGSSRGRARCRQDVVESALLLAREFGPSEAAGVTRRFGGMPSGEEISEQ
jgi:hypothetical protein